MGTKSSKPESTPTGIRQTEQPRRSHDSFPGNTYSCKQAGTSVGPKCTSKQGSWEIVSFDEVTQKNSDHYSPRGAQSTTDLSRFGEDPIVNTFHNHKSFVQSSTNPYTNKGSTTRWRDDSKIVHDPLRNEGPRSRDYSMRPVDTLHTKTIASTQDHLTKAHVDTSYNRDVGFSEYRSTDPRPTKADPRPTKEDDSTLHALAKHRKQYRSESTITPPKTPVHHSMNSGVHYSKDEFSNPKKTTMNTIQTDPDPFLALVASKYDCKVSMNDQQCKMSSQSAREGDRRAHEKPSSLAKNELGSPSTISTAGTRMTQKSQAARSYIQGEGPSTKGDDTASDDVQSIHSVKYKTNGSASGSRPLIDFEGDDVDVHNDYNPKHSVMAEIKGSSMHNYHNMVDLNNIKPSYAYEDPKSTKQVSPHCEPRRDTDMTCTQSEGAVNLAVTFANRFTDGFCFEELTPSVKNTKPQVSELLQPDIKVYQDHLCYTSPSNNTEVCDSVTMVTGDDFYPNDLVESAATLKQEKLQKTVTTSVNTVLCTELLSTEIGTHPRTKVPLRSSHSSDTKRDTKCREEERGNPVKSDEVNNKEDGGDRARHDSYSKMIKDYSTAGARPKQKVPRSQDTKLKVEVCEEAIGAVKHVPSNVHKEKLRRTRLNSATEYKCEEGRNSGVLDYDHRRPLHCMNDTRSPACVIYDAPVKCLDKNSTTDPLVQKLVLKQKDVHLKSATNNMQQKRVNQNLGRRAKSHRSPTRIASVRAHKHTNAERHQGKAKCGVIEPKKDVKSEQIPRCPNSDKKTTATAKQPKRPNKKQQEAKMTTAHESKLSIKRPSVDNRTEETDGRSSSIMADLVEIVNNLKIDSKQTNTTFKTNESNTGNTPNHQKRSSIELHIPVYISKEHILGYVEQYLSPNTSVCLDYYESKANEVKSVISFDSQRQARKAVTQLCKTNTDIKVSAKCVEESISPVDVKKLTAEAFTYMMKRAQRPLSEHQRRITQLEREITDRRNSQSVQLSQYAALCDILDASRNKLEELQGQKREITRFIEHMKTRLDQAPSRSISSVRKHIQELKVEFGLELNKLNIALPMYAKRSAIIDRVTHNQVSVILGETGSGKSTQMTQYLAGANCLSEGMIVCTQPRKVAAISLAQRVAEEMGSQVGKLVGYKVGSQCKQSANTKIMYVTDHILLNECISNPNLDRYSCIIVDEAHERSIYTDLLLGMIKKALPRRPDIRLIVTSATIDPKVFVDFFQCSEALKVSGRAFPVDVDYEFVDHRDEYIEAAVDKAIEIHQYEPPGDVLVFLTSPLDTDKATAQFERKVKKHDVLCMQIHGQQQPSEQQKVFKPSPNQERKVIFATNCAETSITIPGIKYVVDTGLAKEKLYDAKKNMSVLDICYVSKSSADQRKGRAGRTESGKCFRLYTKETFQQMRTVSTPEILRSHLGQSLLKLMVLGISDATEFDFVQSPPKDALQMAKTTLEELGAIDSQGLTELGKNLAALSIEPRLGKLILDSIDKGIGFEGIAVAGLGMVGYNVFFRGKTKEEKEKSDKLKIKLCHPRGDIFTFLTVFREWNEQPERKRNNWCTGNSVNAKSMRITRDNIADILKLLDKELHIKVPYAFNNESKIEEVLPSLLVSCYRSHISHFSGHRSVGYIPINRPDDVHPIHPGSAVNCLRREPTWIIYDQILHTSQQFALVVTCVSEADLVDKIDISDLESKLVHPTYIPNMGPWMIRQIVWKTYGTPQKMEKAMLDILHGNQHSGNVCFDVSKDKCVLYTQHQNRSLLLKHFSTLILPLQVTLRNECHEFPIIEDGLVRCLLMSGGNLRTILMPNQARSVTIDSIPDGYTEDRIQTFMSQYGEIEKIFQTRHTRNSKSAISWGKVIYLDHKTAIAAVEDLADGNQGFKVSSDIPKTRSNQPEAKLRVSWCRRKLRGFGFVTFFDETEAAVEASRTRNVHINGRSVNVSISRKDRSQLYLTNIPADVNSHEVKNVLQEEMHSPIKDVALIREKSHPTTNNDIEMYQRRITTYVHQTSNSNSGFEVQLFKPRDHDFTLNGIITFDDATKAERIMNRDVDISIEGNTVRIEMQLQKIDYIDKQVYSVIKDSIDLARQELMDQFDDDVSIESEQLRNGNFRVKLTASTSEAFIGSSLKLSKITDGTVEELNNALQCRMVSSAKGLQVIRDAQKSHRVHIQHDRWKGSLVIFGRPENKIRASEAIKQFLNDIDKISVQEISLAGEGRPFGLMRALFLQYDVNMNKFQEECELDDVYISVYNHVLKVCGSKASLVKAQQLVDDLAKTLPETKPMLLDDEEECPVCFCPVDDDAYRTETCGHLYCQSCVDGLVHHVINSKEFPIKCAKEDCAGDFVLQDIYNLVGKSRAALGPLVTASTDYFVSQNKTKFHYCITPGCHVVYRSTTNRSKFVCPNKDCKVTICTACNIKYHAGFSCEMHRGLTNDSDHGLMAWIKNSPETRTACPKCGVGIEKDGGCQHMTCKCGAHICWCCKKVFKGVNATHDHLVREHNGIF